MKDFKDKVAVVTGGTSGIGRAIAARCANEGMRVVIAGMNESALAKVARDLGGKAGTVIAVKTDVSQIEQVE